MATSPKTKLLLPILLLLSSSLLVHSFTFDSYMKREHEEGGGEQGESGPYFFDKQSFKTWEKTRHGHFKVLDRFTERSPELFQGIHNYRLAILTAEPKTFILPSHWDAEEVFYVIEGRGTIKLLWENNRESHNIRKGDIMRIPAGTIVYLVNNDDNEKLRIAMLLNPVSTPGRFEEFFGVGGIDPQPFYKSFSTEVLEAAFNAPRDKFERIFGQQKGVFVKASDEQIRALSERSEGGGGGGGWPFGQSNKPFNLLRKQPSHSNEHGELFEATSNDYQQLRDVDIDVSLVNITRGSMMAPNYNSRATKLAWVVDGEGYFEMACPHLSGRHQKGREWEQERRGKEHRREWEGEQGEEEHGQSTRYQTVRSRASKGSLFIIPPGHPVAAVAARGKNLQILCFGIRAQNNEKFFLAGRNNVLNQMEKEAKELSFGRPAREVEEVFNAQKEAVFFTGPKEQQEVGRGRHRVSNVLSFAEI